MYARAKEIQEYFGLDLNEWRKLKRLAKGLGIDLDSLTKIKYVAINGSLKLSKVFPVELVRILLIESRRKNLMTKEEVLSLRSEKTKYEMVKNSNKQRKNIENKEKELLSFEDLDKLQDENDSLVVEMFEHIFSLYEEGYGIEKCMKMLGLSTGGFWRAIIRSEQLRNRYSEAQRIVLANTNHALKYDLPLKFIEDAKEKYYTEESIEYEYITVIDEETGELNREQVEISRKQNKKRNRVSAQQAKTALEIQERVEAKLIAISEAKIPDEYAGKSLEQLRYELEQSVKRYELYDQEEKQVENTKNIEIGEGDDG